MAGDELVDREPDEEQAELGEATPPEPFRGPPLRIAHFFAWMTVAAVLITITQHEFGNRHAAPTMLDRGLAILLDMRLAAGMVGLWVLWRCRTPNMLRRLQAGHWLVIGLTGIRVVIHAADLCSSYIATATWSYTKYDVPQGLLSAYDACVWFAAAGFFAEAFFWFFALCHVHDSGPWHAVLWTLVFDAPAWGLYRLSEQTVVTPSTVTTALGALVLAYAVCTSRERFVRHDWLHWLGAGILVADHVESILWLVAPWLGLMASP